MTGNVQGPARWEWQIATGIGRPGRVRGVRGALVGPCKIRGLQDATEAFEFCPPRTGRGQALRFREESGWIQPPGLWISPVLEVGGFKPFPARPNGALAQEGWFWGCCELFLKSALIVL
jgi:hypothetical protein